MATLIREAVEAYVPDDEPARRARVQRALRAESFTSGLADVSARHDDYLAEDPRGW
jgi:hypothetical protein